MEPEEVALQPESGGVQQTGSQEVTCCDSQSAGLSWFLTIIWLQFKMETQFKMCEHSCSQHRSLSHSSWLVLQLQLLASRAGSR